MTPHGNSSFSIITLSFIRHDRRVGALTQIKTAVQAGIRQTTSERNASECGLICINFD